MIVDADGGANINLLVIGSARFFKNSMIETFDGIAKLVLRFGLRNENRIITISISIITISRICCGYLIELL